ncbi:MAG: hypothetical protein AB4372_24045 [Xenococcus sp. (in: cyanobacteria)]
MSSASLPSSKSDQLSLALRDRLMTREKQPTDFGRVRCCIMNR